MTRYRIQSSSSERGYSLIEVLVSAGVLAGVLLSISTMFIAGTQGVRSGRDLTNATTIANSIMEDALSWPYETVYGMTGGTKLDSSVSWDTDQANPAYVGTPEQIVDWGARADAWREWVREDLQDGLVTYRVEGVARLPQPGNPGLTTFRDALYLRMTVTVAWTESRGRRRHVSFEQLVL